MHIYISYSTKIFLFFQQTNSHKRVMAFKVICILALVLAAVSASHVDLASELDRMAIVPEERWQIN